MPEFTKEALRVLEWTVIDAVKIGTRKLREEINEQITKIERKLDSIMITEAQFKTDLAAALTTFSALIAAINAKIEGTPAEDWRDLDTELQTAAANAQTAIAALNPPTPPPKVTPPPPAEPSATEPPIPGPTPTTEPAPAPAVQQTTPGGAPLPPTPAPQPAATPPAP